MNATASPSPLAAAAQSEKRRLRQRWLWQIGGGLIVLVLAVAGYLLWRMNYVPADLDTATTRPSDQGIYRGSYWAQRTPISINQMHTWVLHLEDQQGQPLTAAQITVDGGMPQHGHGLPTAPQVTKELGNGDHQVEGLKFHMPGWWVVQYHITAQGKSDTVTFNLVLQ